MQNIPANLKYTATHEWVKIENNIATIGITHHAQSLLGDIVFVELPPVNRQTHAKEECVVLESVKAAADVYAPVSGRILETNAEVKAHPALINSDPYEKGWILKIEIQDVSEVAHLLDGNAYNHLIENE